MSHSARSTDLTAAYARLLKVEEVVGSHIEQFCKGLIFFVFCASFLETCIFGLIYLVEEVGGCDIDQFFKASFLRHRYLFFGKMHFWIDLLVSPKPKSIFIIFPQIIETSSRFYLKPLVSKSMENCGQTAMSLGNIIFCVTLTSTMNLGKEYCMFHG